MNIFLPVPSGIFLGLTIYWFFPTSGMEMYFDIEVAYEDEKSVEKLRQGLRGPSPLPSACKIITIQYQFLDKDGKAKAPLQIFKEWESSEEEIIKKFYPLLNPQTKWEFIPVGQNISFDLGMLRSRAARYGVQYDEWFIHNDLPKIDIKSILLGMNGFVFKDSGLDKFTEKESSGVKVPVWYADREYEKILEYIRKETEEFIRFYSQLKILLPQLRKENKFF